MPWLYRLGNYCQAQSFPVNVVDQFIFCGNVRRLHKYGNNFMAEPMTDDEPLLPLNEATLAANPELVAAITQAKPTGRVMTADEFIAWLSQP
jgi:hypothetical protein